MPETMHTAYGTALAEPTTTVHRHDWNWAREGRASCAVHERDFKHFTLFSTTCEPDGRWVAAGFLGAIVDLRLSEGYQLVSMDIESAVLRKPA